MIVEGICSFAASIIRGIFGLFETWTLPFDLIGVLTEILRYGTWVVGSDVLLLVTGSIVFWWTVKASVGVAIWIYDKLPLT